MGELEGEISIVCLSLVPLSWGFLALSIGSGHGHWMFFDILRSALTLIVYVLAPPVFIYTITQLYPGVTWGKFCRELFTECGWDALIFIFAGLSFPWLCHLLFHFFGATVFLVSIAAVIVSGVQIYRTVDVIQPRIRNIVTGLQKPGDQTVKEV